MSKLRKYWYAKKKEKRKEKSCLFKSFKCIFYLPVEYTL